MKKSSKSWNLWGKNNSVSIKIDYFIKLPVSNNVQLSNDYGNIIIDKLEGRADLDLDYGNLHIGELSNAENNINMDYAGKSSVDYMNNGTVNVDYSTLHIEKSGNVNLNADYSHLSYGTVENLDFNCDYGTLKIGTSGDISGSSDYMHSTIGSLNGSGRFNTDYGSLKIGNLESKFGTIEVESKYAHVSFGVSSNVAFNFNADLNYTGFKKS